MTTDELKTKVGQLIQLLFTYLDQQTEAHPSLRPAIVCLGSAIDMYGAQDYDRARTQAVDVLNSIKALRSVDPSIPSP